MRLVAFCEAPSDFQLASALIDRVLREHATWIADVLDSAPGAIRTWIGDGDGREFFDIHKVVDYALKVLPRIPQGHFDGRPGAAGASMARTVFTLVRELNKRRDTETIDGVVLVWDMDGQTDERRLGLDQARAYARALVTFQILLARPDRMREAWVLAGFDAQSPDEQARLSDERAQLGFAPNDQAHLLTAADEQAKRSPKRVLAVFTGADRQREAQCWTDTALSTLRARGIGSGLTEFLEEIEQQLVPLCTRQSPR